MRELTNGTNGSQRWKESQPGQTSSTAISRLSERLNDQGWLRDATVDDLQPLVDFAWRDVTAAAGSQIARKAVSIVMQAYRTPDLTNPAAFVDMAVGALEDMPSIVLAELASPKIGIVRESKFPPTIAEMVRDLKSWSIGADEIAVSFDPYAVGAYAEGAYTCSFPTKDVKALALKAAPLP